MKIHAKVVYVAPQDSKQLADISALPNLIGLTLSVDTIDASHSQALSNLSRLQGMNLRTKNLSSLEGFGIGFSSLQYLSLAASDSMPDLSPLASCPRLRRLELETKRDGTIPSLSGLEQVPSLEKLASTACPDDLSAIARLPRFSELSLGGTITAGQLAPLTNSTSITRIISERSACWREEGVVDVLTAISSLNDVSFGETNMTRATFDALTEAGLIVRHKGLKDHHIATNVFRAHPGVDWPVSTEFSTIDLEIDAGEGQLEVVMNLQMAPDPYSANDLPEPKGSSPRFLFEPINVPRFIGRISTNVSDGATWNRPSNQMDNRLEILSVSTGEGVEIRDSNGLPAVGLRVRWTYFLRPMTDHIETVDAVLPTAGVTVYSDAPLSLEDARIALEKVVSPTLFPYPKRLGENRFMFYVADSP